MGRDFHQEGVRALPLKLDRATGCLPSSPLFHDATIEEVEAAFVDAFPGCPRRRRIFGAYLTHTRRWAAIIGEEPREQWLDGSFTTAEAGEGRPGDVDVVVCVSSAVIEALRGERLDALRGLFGGGGLCHASLIRCYPEGHPARRFEDETRAAWQACFSRQRPEDGGHRKGIVRLWVGRDSLD
jgi:hypothetical protein